ncbi:MAG: baseplate J/gp47 family protein, partial [Clostridiales bacterium]|nr:baseplate J/gp47 family protein [Clostridiales bacterium]
MIDFSEYTREYIQEQMLDQVDEDIDTREGSMVQTAVGPGAWFLEGLYMTLAQMQDNSYSQTAVGEYLDMITEGRGIVRKAAIPAVRQGTFDAQIPENSIFQTLNGDNSVNFVSGDLISHVGSTYVYKLTCQEPGIIGNSYTGPILPVTAINNLTQASIGAIITAGSDEETDDALRTRYNASFEVPAFGGNISSYRNTILGLSGVGAVQVYPAYQGGGTVLCSILGSDFKPASSALVDYVQNYICPPEDGGNAPSPNGYGFAPIGAAVDIVTATELEIDVEFDITMETGIPF